MSTKPIKLSTESFIQLTVHDLGMSMCGIDIAKYLARLEKAGMGNPLGAIQSCVMDLANEIKTNLGTQESLATVNGQAPLLENYSVECQMWAIALLASAWTEWVLTAKMNNEAYRVASGKKEAAINAELALPYIECSIIDAMRCGSVVGRNAESKYRPENTSAVVKLRKS